MAQGDPINLHPRQIKVDLLSGDGLLESGSQVTLGLPSNVSIDSINYASGSTHSHAVISASAPSGSSILASDSSGYLQLVRLGLGIHPSTRALDVVGDARVSTNMYLGGTLYHEGDINTYLSFGNDYISLAAGTGIYFDLDDTSATKGIAYFNQYKSDIDFIINSTNLTAIYVDGLNDNVAFGTSASPLNARVQIHDDDEQLRLVRLSDSDDFASFHVDSNAYLNIGSSGSQVRLESSVRIQSDNYASQTTGWGITYAGGGDFRYLYADEMHVKSFIADLEQALAGGQIIAKSVGVLAEDFALPAAGSGSMVVIQDLPGATGMQVFEANDFVSFRQFSRTSGSLSVGYAWGVVTSYNDVGDGTQTWTWTRDSGSPGTASGTIEADSLAIDWGVSGNGYYEVNAIDGLWSENSPYMQIVTWDTDPGNRTVRLRAGNLKGITSGADEYGMWAGDSYTDDGQYLRISNTNFDLHNLDLILHDGSNPVIQLLHDEGLKVSSGAWNSASTVFAAMINNDATIADLDQYDLLIGRPFDTDPNGLFWDDSAKLLNIYGSVLIGSDTTFATDAIFYLPFDGPGPTNTNFWIQTADAYGLTPSTANNIAGWKGRKGGKSLICSEATTNLIANPVFNANITDGWLTVSATPTWNQNSFLWGNGAAYLTPDSGTACQLRSDNIVLNAGNSISISAWVKSGSGANAHIFIYDVTNTTSRGQSGNAGTDGEWDLLTKSWTNDTGGSVQLNMRLRNNGDDGSASFFDGCQMEQNAYPTPFYYGDMPGGSWDGTPHDSTSTRSAHELEYTIDLPNSFTISLWINTVALAAEVDSYDRILAWRFDDDNRVFWQYHHAFDYIYAFMEVDNVVTYQTDSAADFERNTWTMLTQTFDASAKTCKWYRDGVLLDTDTGIGLWPVGSRPNTLYVGQQENTLHANAYIDDLIVWDRVLSAEEIKRLHSADKIQVTQGNSLILGAPVSGSGGYVYGNYAGLFGRGSSGEYNFALANDTLSWGTGAGNMGAGDLVLGDYGGSNEAWLWYKQSDGDLVLGTETVIQFKVDGADNLLKFGQNTSSPATTAIAVFGSAITYNSESMGAGDMLLGDNSSGCANVLWDKSEGRMRFRGGTTTQAYIDTDGSIRAGGSAVAIDSNGISIHEGGVKLSRVGWYDGADLIGYIGTSHGGEVNLDIYAQSNSASYDTYIRLISEHNTLNRQAWLKLIDETASGYAEIDLWAGNSTKADGAGININTTGSVIYIDGAVKIGTIVSTDVGSLRVNNDIYAYGDIGITTKANIGLYVQGEPGGQGDILTSGSIRPYRYNGATWDGYTGEIPVSEVPPITVWNVQSFSRNGSGSVNLNDYGVPLYVKTVDISLIVKDSVTSGCPRFNKFFSVGPTSASPNKVVAEPRGGDYDSYADGWTPVTLASGSVPILYWYCLGSGVSTTDVTMKVWGYTF